MRSIAQAWNHLWANKKIYLLFGVFSSALVSLTFYIPGSAIWTSISFLIISEAGICLKDSRSFQNFKVQLFNKPAKKLFLILLSMPPVILLGSGIGFLQSPHGVIVSLPMSFSVLTITFYFLFIFNQSLLIDSKKISFAKSLDLLFLTSLKKATEFLGLCFVAAFLTIAAIYTEGIGFIVTIPLIILSNIFCYKNSIEPLLQLELQKLANVDSRAADARLP